MKLSVIVPCLNGADTIANQLEALARQRWSEEWEVIVADNGSTDGSQSIVMRYRGRIPNLRIVDASDSAGQPHALNVGAESAVGESVAFCDVDDEVAPGWVAGMGNALMAHDFVCCRLEVEKLNQQWVKSARGAPQQHEIPIFSYPPFLAQAGSGTIGIKRVLHQELGGFDESMPVHFDTDYCFRAQLKGIKLHFVPDAILHVRYRDTISGIYRQARMWGQYHVLLYKRYRSHGMPKLSWKEGILAWKALLVDVRHVRDKATFASWLWRFAWRLGRVQGCIRHRVCAF